ncbi:MAG TPA: nucleotidyltransferase family protein [Solirubrobacteraceae bacterium]
MTRFGAVSVEDELSLGLAGTVARRQLGDGALLELAHQSNPDRLLAVLGRQRLVNLGIARLGELGAKQLVVQVADRSEPRLQAARWKAVEQEMLTHSLAGTLEQHHIRAVPLKGAALARNLFDDPGLRESDDVDLLVSAGQLERAVELVRDQFGYDAPGDALTAGGRPLLHYRLSHPDGWPMVELHWRVHWYEARSGPAMLTRAVVEQGLARLAAADELACLLLVYARDGFAGIRPLADLAAWWDRYADRLPAGGLGAFAREFPELGPALSVASALADVLVGVPADRLGLPSCTASPRVRRAMRLANWQLAGEDEQIFADIALVDLLLTPRADAWPFIRRQVLLPLDVAAGRLLEAPSTRSRLALAAALHVPRILARFVLAMLGTAGRRRRSVLSPPLSRVPSARNEARTSHS